MTVKISPMKWHGRWLLLGATLSLALVALGVGWRLLRPPAVPAARSSEAATAYLNVQPDVGYVGDGVCAGCHRQQAETFARHPMGQSLAPVASAEALEEYDRRAHNPFDQVGFRYQVDRRDGRIWHSEFRPNPNGKPWTSVEVDVAYAVGSGTRARSYLIERDGFIFESPISWYTKSGVWDIAPGYAAENNPHFERPISAGCLFCHANRVEPVPDSTNRYSKPIFQGYTIGCERCHGPGQLHVRLRTEGDTPAGEDYTIVNPRHLEPALREAVCQQCHLQGQPVILRHNRQEFDYRPGLPLSDFRTVFVKSGSADRMKFAGHVEQMYVSRCFKQSAGAMGCISCHDPHFKPEPSDAPAYFRTRCLGCHQQESCSLPLSERRATSRDDDCTACHMPRRGTSNIPHAVASDHRIPRRPGSSDYQETVGEFPIMPFGVQHIDPADTPMARDLGIALAGRNWTRSSRTLAPIALSMLDRAQQEWPDDPDVYDARGRALWLLGRLPEALDTLEACLAKNPNRCSTLADCARVASASGQTETALRHLEHLVHEAPWYSFYQAHLARLLLEKQEWARAADHIQTALRLNPAEPETHRLFVTYSLHVGKKQQAQKELDILIGLLPNQSESLRHWFAEQSAKESR
jgi:predicted CXXCH cytochrome family protein